MLTTGSNKNSYQISKKLSYVSLSFFLMFLLSACSAVPSESSAINEEVRPATQVEKGPYETAVMNQPSVVSYEAPDDPLRFINEPIFTFNDNAYQYVFSPLASGYQKIVPQPIDTGISNFFSNLREPLYAINHLLQGSFAESGESAVRFLTNTTLGLVGLFDPANDWMDIPSNKTTFDKTLAAYGVGRGSFLVLPLLGPTNVRGISSTVFNSYAHPLNFIHDQDAAQQLLIFDGIHGQIPLLSRYPAIVAKVENKYEFIRNLYLQGLQRDQAAEATRKLQQPDTE
ncbi:MAG: MlaA family lipoprotein [Thalassotalea sp.]